MWYELTFKNLIKNEIYQWDFIDENKIETMWSVTSIFQLIYKMIVSHQID